MNFWNRIDSCNFYWHTYIHNWPLRLFSLDNGLASHTTHVVCVNFIRLGITDFWETFSWQDYLLSEFFPEISWEEIPWKYFFSYFAFLPDLGHEPEIINQSFFSLFISTYEILTKSESTVLKFNYSDSFVLSSTLIYKYRLQWVWVQRWYQTLTIRNIIDS